MRVARDGAGVVRQRGGQLMLLKNLAHDLLMDKQARREVATAEMIGRCILQAPTIEAKIRITRFQRVELKHYQFLARRTSELGVDMDGT
jgi:hypothetical protein